MFRLVFTLIGVVLIGLGSGYLMWGSRVAFLTESLNSMVLEQETLRARLTVGGPAPTPGAAAAAPVEGEEGEPGAAPTLAATDLGTAVGALKDEVQYQAKLIDEQTRLINRLLEASEREGGPGLQTCQQNMQVLTGQLQQCRGDVDALKSRLSAAGVGRLPAAPRPPGVGSPNEPRRGIPVPPPY